MQVPDKVTVYRQLIAHFVGKGMSRIEADRAAKVVLDDVVERLAEGKSLDEALAAAPAGAPAKAPADTAPALAKPKKTKAPAAPKSPSKKSKKK